MSPQRQFSLADFKFFVATSQCPKFCTVLRIPVSYLDSSCVLRQTSFRFLVPPPPPLHPIHPSAKPCSAILCFKTPNLSNLISLYTSSQVRPEMSNTEPSSPISRVHQVLPHVDQRPVRQILLVIQTLGTSHSQAPLHQAGLGARFLFSWRAFFKPFSSIFVSVSVSVYFC